MADVTLVNGQITDAVTQGNVLAVGSLPATAAGNLSTAASQAFAVMMANNAAAQAQSQTIADAATARSVAIITHR